ncbi:MAG: alpha/beta fold hydrolase, partial [Planctomycetota bacterium]
DASAGVDVMETVAKFAASDQSAAAICDIENPRVAADVAAWRRLRDAANGDDASPAHAASVTAADTAAIDPDAWREAVAQHADINVEIRWASSNSPERYDVVLRRPSHTQRANSNTGEQHEAAAEVDWRQFTNRPLDEKRTAQLAPRLRDGLADQLPSYMLPAAYVLMDALPTTVQGKVDRDALPPPPTGRPAWTTGYVEPANKEERLVARVWEEMLGLSPVGAEDDFFELGGHSMLAVRVMAEIEERSGVPIPLAALFQEPTVRHLAKVLSDPDAAEAASSLIPLQASGDGTPLFCIHPAGGTVFCYKALAAHFAGERPVIGVQALGVDGRRAPHETMDAMADYYAGLLKKQFPNGPYHVCGWSLGGNIAYAVAAKLRAAGETVGLVGLFDAGATPPEESLSEDDLGPLLQALFPDFDHLPLEELRQLSPEEQVAYFTERASQAGLVDAAQLASSKHVYSVFQKNVQAVHQHRTGKFDGCVTLFRAAEQTGTNPLADDPLLGWGELAGDVETHAVPSDHTQMMHPPQVDTLAEMVREALSKAENALDATHAGF